MFRRGFHVLMLLGIVGCLASIAETAIFGTLGGGHGACEECAAELMPFKNEDPDWMGSGIFECPECGWIVDRNYIGPEPSSVDEPLNR